MPKSFNNTFISLKDVHTITTMNANIGNLHIPHSNTNRKSIDTWNYFTKQLKENLSVLSRDKLKKLITEQFFESYIKYYISFIYFIFYFMHSHYI